MQNEATVEESATGCLAFSQMVVPLQASRTSSREVMIMFNNDRRIQDCLSAISGGHEVRKRAAQWILQSVRFA